MAIVKDITVDCGADYEQEILLTLDNGDPMPLAGFLVRTQCREKFEDVATLWSLAQNDINMQVTDGRIVFRVPHAVSDNIQQRGIKRGYWDIELTSPSGFITRLVQGRVYFNFQVTKD